MDTVLFLLTAEFPFGDGEPFLETEITALSEAFSRVVLMPQNSTAKKQSRSLPDNVDILQTRIEPTDLFNAMLSILKSRLMLVELLRLVFSHPAALKVSIRSIQSGLSIRRLLKNVSLSMQPHKAVYYSYWLDDASIAIALLPADAPKFARAHGWDVYYERHVPRYLPFRRFLATRLTKIFTVSSDGKKYLDGKTKCPEKIEIMRLGVEPANSLELSSASNQLHVVSISSAIPLKRLALIGEAIQLLKQKQVQWTHFGDGPMLADLKLRFPICDFRGQVSRSEVNKFLYDNSANMILVNASSTEGIPVSMMEAMSCGIPCLGTNVGGVAEIIHHEINGFLLIDSPSPRDLAGEIEKYARLSIEKKIQFRRAAYETWKSTYDANTNNAKLIDSMICSLAGTSAGSQTK